MDVVIFLIFAIIAVACAINVVVQTHPISSAISLVGVMGSLAVIYLLLGAEFIAAAQVIVYVSSGFCATRTSFFSVPPSSQT